MKIKIQKIFTKIRNEINNREDELLLKVDNKFDNLLLKENILRNFTKLSEKIKITLNERKILDKEWKDDNLIFLINDCISIENDINNIQKINNDLKIYDNKKTYTVDNSFQEEQINNFIRTIR